MYTVKIESEKGRKVYPACEQFEVSNADRSVEPAVNPKITTISPAHEIEVLPGEIGYIMNGLGKNIEKVMGIGSEAFWAKRVEAAALRQREADHRR